METMFDVAVEMEEAFPRVRNVLAKSFAGNREHYFGG